VLTWRLVAPSFDIADGYTVPTELVLVPMLFALPTPSVPLVVSLSWALGRIAGYATGATSARRAFHVFGDSCHALGPTLVLVLAEPRLSRGATGQCM